MDERPRIVQLGVLREVLARRSPASWTALLAALLATSFFAKTAPCQCTTEHVNVSSEEAPGTGAAGGGAITSDGRFVVFNSSASDLVAGDTNGVSDVFVRDLWTGETILVSRNSSGEIGDNISTDACISSDGRYVTFLTAAHNFEPTPDGSHLQLYLRDLQLGLTVRVSENAAGELAAGPCSEGVVSDDGSIVCFVSEAPNLVPGDTNSVADVFVYDLVAAAPSRVSVSSAGEQATDECVSHDMSENGRWIVFHSRSSNLDTDITNGFANIFLHDRLAKTMKRIGLNQGHEGNGNSFDPAVSRDGGTVVFKTQATDLFEPDTNEGDDVLVWRKKFVGLQRASQNVGGEQANAGCDAPSISPDGHFVAYYSGATNLISGDVEGRRDVFVNDLRTGTIVRVTQNDLGEGANADAPAAEAALSGGACVATFLSDASNLGSGDEFEGWQDLFARKCPPPPARYCLSEVNSSGSAAQIDYAGSPSITGNDFTLVATGGPLSNFAILFAGPAQTLLFFGDGYLCVSAGGGVGLHRLGPPILTDATGYIARRLDFLDRPVWVLPGSVWNFQFWFRDPNGPGGSGFNLSDALNVVFFR